MSRLEPTNEASAMQKEISAIAEQGGGRATKVEQLIQQYCPDGVEYKKLGDVCDIKGRIGFRGYTRQDLVEEADGAITLSPSNIINQELNYEDCSYISWAKYEESPEIKVAVGDVIFTKTASVGKTALVKYLPKEATINPQLVVLKNIQCNSAFLAYVLKTYRFQKEVAKLQGVGSVPNISQTSLSGITIPIPPLPVQEEIVRILDSFTELQAELQAELQKRLQQYNYYRDNLLSFEGRTDVEWKKLGEIATDWYRGAGIKRDEVSEEGIPCIRYGEIHTTYNIWFDECVSHTDENKQPAKKYADYGDILFAITSEDIPFIGNSVAYIGKERILVGGDIVVMKHTQNPKYMSYVLSTSDAVMQKGKGKVKSKVVHTSVPSLKEIVVPIPSLEEQERIATILDKFYTLTTDITAGLPAEIEARRKQYEYYRDQLLTFKQKA